MGLNTVETVLWAEQAFGIEIPDTDASAILSVGEFSAYIHGRLPVRYGDVPLTEPQVYERIRQFLIEHLGVKPELITRQAEFVKDLRLE